MNSRTITERLCQDKYFELLQAAIQENPLLGRQKRHIDFYNQLKVRAARETGDQETVNAINNFRRANKLPEF